MDIETFKAVAKSLPGNISIMVRGGHGIGKSETIQQIAEELGFEPHRIFDRRMSQMTEGDVIGLPKVEDGVTRFLPPDWIRKACDEPCFLFLDEINRATQEVMQACFQLCLDREINGNRLHPGTRVFSAVNATGMYQVTEMDPAFLDRFYIVDLTPTGQDLFAYAESIDPATNKTRLDADLIRFLKERDSRLDPSPNASPGTIQPSRRSWFRLDKAFRANAMYEKDFAEDQAAYARAYSLALGFVGQECANDLVDSLKTREKRFTALNVLHEYDQHRSKIHKLGQDKLNTLIDMLVEHAKANTIAVEEAVNLGKFVSDLPGELRVSFITNYTRETRKTPLFTTNFKTINSHVMPHVVSVFNDKKQLENAVGGETAAAEASATTTKKKSKK